MSTNNDALNRRLQAFLAIATTFGFFGVIAALMVVKDIPAGVKDILLVMLGTLIASYKEITGFFFGSSAGSAGKDATIAAQAAASTSQAPVLTVAPQVSVAPEAPVSVAPNTARVQAQFPPPAN